MQEPIYASKHPTFKSIVDKLIDLQDPDGLVLSVQLNAKGEVFVGTRGQFESLEKFKAYLTKNGFNFENVGINENGNYFMRDGEIKAEFYRLD